MKTLKDLLELAKLERGVKSGRALAELAARHGFQIDRTQVNHILSGTYKSRPGRPLLEAIGWLAGVPIHDVYAAARLPLPGPAFAEELPPEADQLLPHERAAVIGIVRAFLRTAAINDDSERSDLSWQERVSLLESIEPGYAQAALGDGPTAETLTDPEKLDSWLRAGPHLGSSGRSSAVSESEPESRAAAAMARWQAEREEVKQLGLPSAIANDVAFDLVREQGGVADALTKAHEMHERMDTSFSGLVLDVLEEWEADEAEAPLAARSDQTGQPSRGQRNRRSLDAAGEENQDDTAAS